MTEKPRAAGPEETGPAPGGSATSGAADGHPGERVVIRDKRRIDPSGARHATAGQTAGPAGDGAPDGSESPRDEAAQRGADSSRGDQARPDGARHRRDEDPRGSGTSGHEESSSGGSAENHAPDDDADRVDDRSGERSDDGGRPDAAGDSASSVVDERELSEMLADEKQPEAPAPPVVDEPTPPVGGESADGAGSTDGGGSADGAGPLGAELEALRAELDERTSDLQRVSAEYANYRKRVDRDRGLVAEQTTGSVLSALLPILDDLDRAREHGDLVGPFGTVAEQLTAAVGKLGLIAFGEKGDPFDPTRHEAVAHLTSAEVSEPTCVEVMRRGYLLGERLLRPALVAVADPE